MKVERYIDSAAAKNAWDRFVGVSKNGTFLFFRDYMDYHRDRFVDHSLIIRDDRGDAVALLPANENRDTHSSHDGLTYGGFIVDSRMALPTMTKVFEAATQYLTDRGFRRMTYKTIPYIYHCVPSEEDRCCLFRSRGRCYRRDALTVIEYGSRIGYQARRRRSIGKAIGHRLIARESHDYEQFWEFLSENLQKRYGRSPVHTVGEMKLLASRFPENIRLFATYEKDRMTSGAVLYLSRNVCHVQYNAADERGKTTGALDLLIDHLIGLHAGKCKYFDLGVSTEENGRHLNTGLIDYKEGFGGRTVVHDFYEIDLQEQSGGVE
jgi:hypothetical protein